jgi:hypothetical protein
VLATALLAVGSPSTIDTVTERMAQQSRCVLHTMMNNFLNRDIARRQVPSNSFRFRLANAAAAAHVVRANLVALERVSESSIELNALGSPSGWRASMADCAKSVYR